MPASVTLSFSTLYGFLLVLARVAGVFIFLPIPGIKDGPQPARIVRVLALTLALYPKWPDVAASSGSTGRIFGFVLEEAAFGITVGLAVAFLAEALLFAAHMIAMQAGFAYASTVDPTTEADSSVLLVFAQLGAGLLFFVLGLDRQVLRIFGRSLDSRPPGTFRLSLSVAQEIVRLGGEMLSVGLRLALPVLALVLLVDISLALLGRLNAHLQLLTMAFPAKILTALLLLSWMTAVFPHVYLAYAGRIWTTIQTVLALNHG
jgi:flagellar biosynthetic protein FliR